MTVLLVHAAWADASNLHKVLLQLRTSGIEAVGVQIPLTSLMWIVHQPRSQV